MAHNQTSVPDAIEEIANGGDEARKIIEAFVGRNDAVYRGPLPYHISDSDMFDKGVRIFGLDEKTSQRLRDEGHHFGTTAIQVGFCEHFEHGYRPR